MSLTSPRSLSVPTQKEAASLAREAIELHIADLREQGLSVPSPHTFAVDVNVAA